MSIWREWQRPYPRPLWCPLNRIDGVPVCHIPHANPQAAIISTGQNLSIGRKGNRYRKLHTFQATQDHQTELKQWSARRDQHLAESVELLATLDNDADKTAYAKTQKITRKPSLDAGSPKSDEKEMSSFFASRSSLKKTPVYSEPHERRLFFLRISCLLATKCLVR